MISPPDGVEHVSTVSKLSIIVGIYIFNNFLEDRETIRDDVQKLSYYKQYLADFGKQSLLISVEILIFRNR